MVIGYDGKRLICNDDKTSRYAQSLLAALSVVYKDDIFLIYCPKQSGSKKVNTLFNRGSIRMKGPKHPVWGIWWRSRRGILSRARRHGVAVFHGLAGMLPSAMSNSHMPGVVSIADPDFSDLGWKSVFYRNRAAQACKVAKCIVTPTESDKQAIISKFGPDPERIQVVHPCCHDRFHENVDQQDKDNTKAKYELPHRFLLYYGPMTKAAGLKKMVDMLHAMDDKHIVLVLIGHRTEYYREEVKNYAHSLGVRHRLMHFDKVHRADIPTIIRMSEAVIYADTENTCPMSIVEAHTCNTPVVAFNTPSAREFGGDAVLLGDDAEGMARQVDALLQDEQFRQQVSAASTANAERFSQQAIADQMMGIYRQLFKSSRS